MANTHGEKELKTDYPVEEGLTAGTNKLKKEWILMPEESNVMSREREGM